MQNKVLARFDPKVESYEKYASRIRRIAAVLQRMDDPVDDEVLQTALAAGLFLNALHTRATTEKEESRLLRREFAFEMGEPVEKRNPFRIAALVDLLQERGENVDKLCDLISDAIGNRDSLQTLSQNSRQVAIDRFNRKTIGKELIEFYRGHVQTCPEPAKVGRRHTSVSPPTQQRRPTSDSPSIGHSSRSFRGGPPLFELWQGVCQGYGSPSRSM